MLNLILIIAGVLASVAGEAIVHVTWQPGPVVSPTGAVADHDGVIHFMYQGSGHTVWKMASKAALDACDFSPPSMEKDVYDGDDFGYAVQPQDAGTTSYFACITGSHCQMGMRLVIDVAAAPTMRPTPPITPDPNALDCACDGRDFQQGDGIITLDDVGILPRGSIGIVKCGTRGNIYAVFHGFSRGATPVQGTCHCPMMASDDDAGWFVPCDAIHFTEHSQFSAGGGRDVEVETDEQFDLTCVCDGSGFEENQRVVNTQDQYGPASGVTGTIVCGQTAWDSVLVNWDIPVPGGYNSDAGECNCGNPNPRSACTTVPDDKHCLYMGCNALDIIDDGAAIKCACTNRVFRIGDKVATVADAPGGPRAGSFGRVVCGSHPNSILIQFESFSNGGTLNGACGCPGILTDIDDGYFVQCSSIIFVDH